MWRFSGPTQHTHATRTKNSTYEDLEAALAAYDYLDTADQLLQAEEEAYYASLCNDEAMVLVEIYEAACKANDFPTAYEAYDSLRRRNTNGRAA